MTPAELHAYVVARWTEHRALAEVAGYRDQPWTNFVGPEVWYPRKETPVVIDAITRENAAHIAANDPAYVIAVCDAALRRLARHAPIVLGYEPSQCCGVCVQRGNGITMPEDWPCPEVLDDAAPFADRADFPEELKRRG